MDRATKRLRRALEMFHRPGSPIVHESYSKSRGVFGEYYVREPVLSVLLKSGERIEEPQNYLSKLYTPYAYQITRKNVFLLCRSNVAEYYFRYNQRCIETPNTIAVFSANYSRMLMITRYGSDLLHGYHRNYDSIIHWKRFEPLPEKDEYGNPWIREIGGLTKGAHSSSRNG